MKQSHTVWKGLSSSVLSLAASVATTLAQSLTIQVAQPPSSPPSPLVQHGDTWRYRFGTTEPQADWKTATDAGLDGTWLSGPGGIGYADGDDATDIRIGMSNICSTVYLRKSFTIASAVNPTHHLRLVMDYDDGFVAYLDGAEIVRANTTNAAGSFVAHTATTGAASHEALGYQSLPVDVFDLGLVGSRLGPGDHVLAIIGINQAINSSDLSLISDLSVVPESPVINGPLLALSIVRSNAIGLFGTNSFPGSARVTVNGADTTFDSGTGAWSKTQPLSPGCNRLVIEAVGPSGATLFSTNHTVVSELSSTTVSSLAGNTVWDSSMGIIHVDNSLNIPSGGSLVIHPGTVVLLGPAINLRATAGAALDIEGSSENPVCLFTADATTMWGEIAADGAGSQLTVRHAETIGGAVKGRNGATCLLEDSYFRDYKNGSVPIGGCTSAQSMTVRRCHFRVYHETLWQNTLMLIEECLFELANNPSSDALDFDGAIVGSEIRRCTFRHGPQSNTDAIDIGPTTSGSGSTNTFIHDNLMFDFPNDKGVSIGEGSYGIVVSNCLMYGNDSGVAVKDSPGGKPPCTANILNCTIVDCDYGFRCYNKSMPASPTDGGQITNSYNNIISNSRFATFEILNAGIVIADHSDFTQTNWPGTGNFEADPLFLNAAQRDYRLAANSPCIGAGRDGATLGVTFPVGAPMAPSHPVITSLSTNNGLVHIGFWVDSEKNYTVQTSDVASGGTWTNVADVYHRMCPRFVEVTTPVVSGNRFFRLVTPVQ